MFFVIFQENGYKDVWTFNARSLSPASKGWWEVLFSVCQSTPQQGGGTTILGQDRGKGYSPLSAGWGTPLPAGWGYPSPPPAVQVPRQDGVGGGIACTCYTADGMPLAFTQEDFLVYLFLQSFYPLQKKLIFSCLCLISQCYHLCVIALLVCHGFISTKITMHFPQTDHLRTGKWPHGTVQMGDWWQMYSINAGHGIRNYVPLCDHYIEGPNVVYWEVEVLGGSNVTNLIVMAIVMWYLTPEDGSDPLNNHFSNTKCLIFSRY